MLGTIKGAELVTGKTYIDQIHRDDKDDVKCPNANTKNYVDDRLTKVSYSMGNVP